MIAIRGPERTTTSIPALARTPVFAVAIATGALLLFTSTRYAHGFDELYFLIAGRDHLDWGYFDQPPLVPALAGALDTLFPGSLPALRLPVTVAGAAGVVVTALIARELGGGRSAQVMAAALYAMGGTIRVSHWLATYSLDPFWWTVILWLLIRWVRTRQAGAPDGRLLVWAGVVTAISLQTKFLIPAFWGAVLLAALLLGPRDLLRSKGLWIGAGIAVLATVPTLIWQARNGWAYTEMSEVVAAESSGALATARDGVLGAGLGVGAVALCYGMWRLGRSPALRPYRFLGLAATLVAIAVVLADGRSYYFFGLYALPFAVAAVELTERNLVRWWKSVAWPAFVVSAAVLVAGMPVYPESTVDKLPQSYGPILLGSAYAGGERPSRELAGIVEQTYAALPPEQRARTAVYSEIYPFAAAVDFYGGPSGMPPTVSGHRGYWYFGPPPETADSVLFLGFDPDKLSPYFAGKTPIVPDLVWLYHGRTEPWAQIWPKLKDR